MGEVGRVSGSSEKRDPLDVRLKIIASDVELHAADDEWREFLDQESVVTGFFCDPIVLSCAALLERGDCLILGEVMMADGSPRAGRPRSTAPPPASPGFPISIFPGSRPSTPVKRSRL